MDDERREHQARLAYGTDEEQRQTEEVTKTLHVPLKVYTHDELMALGVAAREAVYTWVSVGATHWLHRGIQRGLAVRGYVILTDHIEFTPSMRTAACACGGCHETS